MPVRTASAAWTWAFWALLALLWVLPVASGMLPASVALGQLALTTLVLFGLVVTHELGHAVLGRLLGYRIFEISFGTGWPIVDTFVGRTRLRLSALPLGGHTLLAPKSDRVVAAREVFVSLAGPTVNLVILGVALVSDWPPQLRILVIVMSAVLVLENLWPREVVSPIGATVSDGLRAARALDLDDDGVRTLLASRYLGETYVDHVRGDHAAAAAWDERGLAAFPGLAAFEGDIATSLVLQGRYEEGRAALRRHLARTDLEPVQRALYENNLAWADLLLDDPDLEAEALERSAAAFAVLPALPAVRGTRGLALIVGGAVDEGIDLCADAYRRHREPAARGANAASIALGAARQGRVATAERYLRRAIQLDPDGALIDRAGEALRAARASVG